MTLRLDRRILESPMSHPSLPIAVGCISFTKTTRPRKEGGPKKTVALPSLSEVFSPGTPEPAHSGLAADAAPWTQNSPPLIQEACTSWVHRLPRIQIAMWLIWREGVTPDIPVPSSKTRMQYFRLITFSKSMRLSSCQLSPCTCTITVMYPSLHGSFPNSWCRSQNL